MEELIGYFSSFGELVSNKSAFVIVLVLIAPTLIASLFFVPSYMVKGFKKGMGGALLLALVSLGSCALSAGLAKLLSLLVVALADERTGKAVEEAFARFSIRIDLPALGHAHLSAFAAALISALVSILLYPLIFLVLLRVFRALTGTLIGEKDRKLLSRNVGLIVGFIDAMLVSFLLFAPLYTLAGSGAAILHEGMNGLCEVYEQAEAEGVLKEKLFEARERFDGAYGTITRAPTVYFAGKAPFDFGRRLFGLYAHEKTVFNAYDQIDRGIGDLQPLMAALRVDPAAYGKEQFEKLREAIGYDEKKEYIAGILDEILAYLGEFLPAKENAPTENTSPGGAPVKTGGPPFRRFPFCRICPHPRKPAGKIMKKKV